MYSDSSLYINLKALQDNFLLIKSKSKTAETAAVVKANGYGIGVEKAAKSLAKAGAKTFFVASLDEALELRKILSKHEILVFNGIRPGQEKIFHQNKITPVLNTIEETKIWEKFCKKNNEKIPAALHFDTGMNRLGLSPESAEEVNKNLDIKYLMSHLACADHPSDPKNSEQLKAFQKVAELFPQAKKSLSNTSGLFLGKDYHFDLLRPGIGLYGGSPNIQLKNPLNPVISLNSKIISLHKIDRETSVGYGATAIVKKGSVVATVPVGYADGYLRALSNFGFCFVNNKKVPVIGRVSMDLITLDVTKIPGISIGDEVELIGKNIPMDEIAKVAGTISYEIFTRLGSRFNRIYIG